MRDIREQFAIDLGCALDKIKESKNVFVTCEPHSEMRYWARSDGNIICFQNRVLCRTNNEELTSSLEKQFADSEGEWFGEVSNLNKLKSVLKKQGYEIVNYAPFFIPMRTNGIETRHLKHLEFYKEHEIPQFKGDSRFEESFCYSEDDPDKKGVSYQVDGEIVAMAGANQNGKYVWEIGIEVFDQYRGKGIASLLVSAITNKIIEENNGKIIPTYGTQFSHVQSMNVAIRSGYKIGWTELMMKKVK